MNKMRYFFLFITLFSTNVFLYSQNIPTSSEVMDYYIACANNDLIKVRSFLEKYPDCVDIELYDDSMLFQDNNLAYIKFANYLIMSGKTSSFMDKNEENEWIQNFKRYPINIASRYGNLDIVKELIKHNANLNLREENSDTPLLTAAQNGHTSVIIELLNAGIDINQKNDNCINALMKAASYGHYETAQELINKNIFINDKSINGLTALHYSIYADDIKILKLLIKVGININEQDNNGTTALAYACIKGKIDFVHELIIHGADITIKSNTGRTNLIVATHYGHLEVVRELINNKINVNETTPNGETALMYAASDGYIDIVKELIKNNADVNKQTTNLSTALSCAIISGHKDIVTILMKNNADLLSDSTILIADLGFALTNNHEDIACMLLKDEKYNRMLFKVFEKLNYRITIDIDNIPMTYLMIGAYYGYIDFTKELLKQNININETNSNGQTALMFAASSNQKEIVSLLVESGADVNAKDNENFYVLQYALIPYSDIGDKEIFGYLLKHGANKYDVFESQ